MKRIAASVVVLLIALLAAPVGAQGVALPFAEGTRVRARGSETIYVVDGGRCRPVYSVAWERLWRGYGGVTEVESVPAEVRGDALMEGTCLVAAYGTTQVWLVENARIRRRIPSVSAFRSWGFALDLVEDVPLALIEALPEGAPLADPGRTLPVETGPAFRGVSYEEWWERFLGAERTTRMEAGWALVAFGPRAPEMLARLTTAMADSASDVRREIAFFAPAAGPDAVPLLTRALADEDPDVRTNALQALCRIGPAAADAAPAVIAMLGGKDPVQGFPCVTLAAIGNAHPAVIPALIGLLPDRDLRESAEDALERIGRPVLPVVRALLDDPEKGPPALLLLARLTPGDERVVPGLVALLDDPGWADDAADLLDAREDLPEFAQIALEAFEEREGFVMPGRQPRRNLHASGGGEALAGRARLYAGLIREAAATEVVSPALAAALADPDWAVRAGVVRMLKDVRFPAAAEALAPALADPDRAVREAALDAFAGMGDAAVETLSGILERGDADAQWRSARALEKIAPKVAGALAVLERHADDADPAVRAAVLRARRDAAR